MVERRSASCRRVRSFATSLLVICTLAACGTNAAKVEKPAGPIDRVAILRVERADAAAQAAIADDSAQNPNPRLMSNAESVLTAQIYGVLANDPHWRLAPDLEVDQAMRQVPIGGSLESRAQALGKATKTDAVVTGRISRFQERVGTDYGVRFPASVSFELELVQVSDGQVLWHGDFDRTQKDLSSNLYDFWMFWRAGPHWFTAAELARLGVEELIEELDKGLAAQS